MNKKTMLYIGLALFSLISFILLNRNNVLQADHIARHVIGQQDPIEKLNGQMNMLYEWSKASNRMATYNQLQTVKLHIKTNHPYIVSKYENWHLFLLELDVLEKQLANKNSHDYKESVTRLYLASDAMVQGEKGPWREYEVLLIDRIRLMESAFINQTQYRVTTIQANLALIDEQLARISLAAQLVGDRKKLDELQFRIVDLSAFMLSLPAEVEQSQYYNQLEFSVAGIKQATLALFENSSTVSVQPILDEQHFPFQLAALLTFVLSLILSFTSYRKYKQSPFGVKRL